MLGCRAEDFRELGGLLEAILSFSISSITAAGRVSCLLILGLETRRYCKYALRSELELVALENGRARLLNTANTTYDLGPEQSRNYLQARMYSTHI